MSRRRGRNSASLGGNDEAFGTAQLSVTVAPDSGTDQLVGLAGKMTINIVDGKQLYEFEYTLAESK